MSETSPASPPPAAGPAEKTNSFQRIVGVLFAPTSTFESIARRPDIAVPLAVFAIVSLIAGVVTARVVDFNAMAREAMEAAGSQMSPEQLERMTRFSAAMMRGTAYASPLVVLLVLAISAGLLLIGFRLMGGEGDFKTAFSITTYAWYPRLIKSVLALIVIVSKKSFSIYDLQDPIRSNPAFLFNPKTQPVMFALATSLDVFTIWSIVLLVIGFAAMSRLPRVRSAVIVIILWVVGIVLSLIGPAMQAMRMKS